VTIPEAGGALELRPSATQPAELDTIQARAYQALSDHAAWVDRSSRTRVTFAGPKAKEALGGLLTNDVARLATGGGMRAAALTPKGRVIALLRVMDRGDDLLLDCDAAAGAGFVAMIRKYVNPRLAKHDEVTAATACVGVYGPQSAEVLAGVIGAEAESLVALEPHASLLAGRGGEAVTIVRSADLAVAGYDVIGTRDRIAGVVEAFKALGLAAADETVAMISRVERGLPQFGIEMDADTIPQEANLGEFGAISFDKGCYTGQEVVARIHFRGHVNKHLRWIMCREPLAAGWLVQDAEGKEVGVVRSAVVSPARGPLAMAMVRREIAPGNDVNIIATGRVIPGRCEAIVA
jgi:folate-binding protein YgfZ